MPSRDTFLLSLDPETSKILKQIPHGFKSPKLREWIKMGAKAEGYDVKAPRGRRGRRESMTDLVRNL